MPATYPRTGPNQSARTLLEREPRVPPGACVRDSFPPSYRVNGVRRWFDDFIIYEANKKRKDVACKLDRDLELVAGGVTVAPENCSNAVSRIVNQPRVSRIVNQPRVSWIVNQLRVSRMVNLPQVWSAGAPIET